MNAAGRASDRPDTGGLSFGPSATDTVNVAGWRTKVGGGRIIAHSSKDEADAAIEDARRRYRAGARALRVVRIYGPDGGVRLIDFESEARNAGRALHDVELATGRKDRDVRAAVARWESVIAAAIAEGESEQAVADAAGVGVRDVRAIVRRAGGPRSG